MKNFITNYYLQNICVIILNLNDMCEKINKIY